MNILHTPYAATDQTYAAGWYVLDRDWAGGLTLSHTGSNLVWNVSAWLAPSRNRIFAVVTNDGESSADGAIDAAFSPLLEKYAN